MKGENNNESQIKQEQNAKIHNKGTKIMTTKTRGFEKVSKYANVDLPFPVRKTDWSAGYDMAAAHDVVVQPLGKLANELLKLIYDSRVTEEDMAEIHAVAKKHPEMAEVMIQQKLTLELDEIKKFMKDNGIKPTLVSTGYKAYMQPGECLELSARSSLPLNSFIILANPPGLIDADYYNNPDNEGEIFFQIINLSPVPLRIRKGDILGQGKFGIYLTTDTDSCYPKQPRKGGFGSTSQ